MTRPRRVLAAGVLRWQQERRWQDGRPLADLVADLVADLLAELPVELLAELPVELPAEWAPVRAIFAGPLPARASRTLRNNHRQSQPHRRPSGSPAVLLSRRAEFDL
jgi:hypothetical protein